MDKSHLIPASILAGSAIIGIGLYFGLRRPEAPAPAPTAPMTAQAARSSASTRESPPAQTEGAAGQTPPPGSAPPAPSVSAGSVNAARAAGKKAVEKLKPGFVAKCWDPIVKKAPEPAKSKYTFMISFDPEGREIGRGISEIRGEDSRPDVATCLREQPMSLKIDPPGTHVSIETSLEFP